MGSDAREAARELARGIFKVAPDHPPRAAGGWCFCAACEQAREDFAARALTAHVEAAVRREREKLLREVMALLRAYEEKSLARAEKIWEASKPRDPASPDPEGDNDHA